MTGKVNKGLDKAATADVSNNRTIDDANTDDSPLLGTHITVHLNRSGCLMQ